MLLRGFRALLQGRKAPGGPGVHESLGNGGWRRPLADWWHVAHTGGRAPHAADRAGARAADRDRARAWFGAGFTSAIRTPDDTVIFVDDAEREVIRKDQADCMGCLSHCGFSSWKDHDDYTTGRLADPRSFCIQKTLQDIAHGGELDDNLMFAGHAAYRFKQDPFYSNNFTPTVKQLVDRILTGD